MARAKAASTATRKTRARASNKPTRGNRSGDAIALLKGDHREVEKLFARYEKAGGAEKRDLARRICRELIVHTMLEEEIFYAACRTAGVQDDILDEAQVEHDGAKVLIADLLHEDPSADYYDAKVAVLGEYIKHHVREEEKPGGIFAKARKAGLDTAAAGARLQARKAELTGRGESPEREPLRTVSLHLQDIHPSNQENSMPRNSNQRDRDDQGRFTSDDDDDNNGRSRGRSMSSRSRSRDDDDDDRGYSSSGRGRGNQDRDDRGRFTGDDDDDDRGSRSRSSRSRYDEDDYDDDRGGRGRSSGHGGWFGDSEGHAQAARQRRQSRSSGRYDSDDDDDRGRSRGRSQGEGRGWFSDPEGRSDASERGWESRQGSSPSRSSRDDDDDDRSSRGRGRGESSRSSRSRQSGHGGWFGDSEGHSEASRRGWQNRD